MGKKKGSQGKSGRAKGRDSLPEREQKTTADYYRLNTKAIDDLAEANEENSPPVSAAELKKYRSGPKVSMADWVKALLLKFWMAGVVCYFFIWVLSLLSINQWDHLAILSISFGLLTNLITNNILRFISKTPGAYDHWMMFPKKGLIYLPLDILYAGVLMYCTVMTYNTLNLLLNGSAEGSAALGVEPILFGIFVTLWDLLFIRLKHVFRHILWDAKQSASGKQ